MANRKIKSNYIDSVRRIAGRFEEKAGWIGISPTQIETGTPDLIWVRFSNNQAVKALNKLAPLVYNYPVKIARSDSSAIWEVTAIRQPYGETVLESLKNHHTQHEYPAADTVFVRDAQFTPLLVLPITGFTINIYGGIVIQDNVYYAVANQTMDLSASQPADAAVWVLIEVVAGVLTATLSAEYDNKELLTVDLIPVGTGVRLCAIQLYAGQEAIQRSNIVNDFVDLRWTQGGNGDVIYLDDLVDVNAPTPSDGQVLTWDNGTSKWIPVTPSTTIASLDDIGDVNVPSPNDGDSLVWDNGTSKWIPVAVSGTVASLDDIGDVNVPAPGDGEVLTWNDGVSEWVAVAPTTGVTDHGALTGLGDDDHTQYLLISGTRAMTGNLDMDGFEISEVDGIQFELTPESAHTLGLLHWSVDDGTLEVGLAGGVELQIGQENLILVKNQTGASLLDGSTIAYDGAVGASGRIKAKYAIADSSQDDKIFLGVATETILNGANGFVTVFGKVRGIDTSGTPYGETWNDGDILYVSSTVAGGWTNVLPVYPNHPIPTAVVIKAHASTGSIFVRVPTVQDFDEIHGINITTPTEGQVLTYDEPTGTWVNEDVHGSVRQNLFLLMGG